MLLAAQRRSVHLLLPTDFIVGDEKTRSFATAQVYAGDTSEVMADAVPRDAYVLDVGPQVRCVGS